MLKYYMNTNELLLWFALYSAILMTFITVMFMAIVHGKWSMEIQLMSGICTLATWVVYFQRLKWRRNGYV